MKRKRWRILIWAGFLNVLALTLSLSLLLERVSARSLQGHPVTVSVVTAQSPKPQLKTESCSALVQHDFSGIPDTPTEIVSAEVVSSTAKTPEYCNVKGLIAPQIQFELRLPTKTWNERYLQVGCGGYCGKVVATPDCNVALDRNFVVAFNNTGHITGNTGASNADGFFGLNAELRNDFGYRSEHSMSLAAKAIISDFYGKSPNYSYFQGCSNGGRQALMAAQRYPDDFNGIIAGAPAAIQAPLNGEYQTWIGLANEDAVGEPILTQDKLALIHNAAIANCDGKDGLVDGLIADPRACTFKPESLKCTGGNQSNCLNAAQIAVVEKLYQGPVDRQGQHLYPGGEAIGSELAWADWIVQKPGMKPISANIANTYLKYLAFLDKPPASYSYKDWQFTVEGFDRLRPTGEIYNATNPNLKGFRDRGGKLILYHGWADPAIPPFGTVAYYQAVQDFMGGIAAVQEFARLFMFPGLYHCSGGTGPSEFDLLTPIIAWVEQGIAPSKIIASKMADNVSGGGFNNPTGNNKPSDNNDQKVVRTRPVFPYPMQAQYTGKGSIDDASNFVGVVPSPLPRDRFDWVGNDLFQPR